VISDPTLGPRLNGAARRLLADVVGADFHLQRLIARPRPRRGVLHRVAVELVEGGNGLLHGHSRPVPTDDAALITVLELERDEREIPERTLSALTPREREVALRGVDGRSDRGIAERLQLSPHRVHQRTRPGFTRMLTRLLRGAPGPDPRG
jgi:DNA-directed RNA polymerase specialized sigma24 family protein